MEIPIMDFIFFLYKHLKPQHALCELLSLNPTDFDNFHCYLSQSDFCLAWDFLLASVVGLYGVT